MAVAYLQAQKIQNGERWWDGSVLYTSSLVGSGGVELIGRDVNGDVFTVTMIDHGKNGEYSVFSRNGALALRIEEGAKVNYIRQEGMNFLAFRNDNGDAAWIMVLTPDNLQDCIAQEKWAEQQPVSNILTGMLLNTTYLARFPKPELRIMRNEILARHGWKFQSKDLQEYFGQQPWYKPGKDNSAIKLNIIEQLNLQLIKSEEATLDEYRNSMLSLENFAGGLADDGRGPEEIDGEQVYKVTTEREFLAALGSDRTVVIAKNVHLNLSRVLENESLFANVPGRRWTSDASASKGNVPLVISESETDGRQLALVNIKNLTIRGAGHSSIEVDPRYSYCLYFINCEGCMVDNLTIGHTEGGTCSGGVIGMKGGRMNVVKNCDLYGCGTYGFDLMETGDFSVLNSLIHDCTYGILQLRSCLAVFFTKCDFFNNREYGLIESWGSDGVVFNDCRFFANWGDAKLFDFDNTFSLMGCEIYHPTENLGTMNMADQSAGKKNMFSSNPFDNSIKSRDIGPDLE